MAERLGMDTSKYECEGFGESYVIYFPNKNEPIVEIMPSIDEIVVFLTLIIMETYHYPILMNIMRIYSMRNI